MTKLIAIAVCDDSKRVIVSPVVNAGKDNARMIFINTIKKAVAALKSKSHVENFQTRVARKLTSPTEQYSQNQKQQVFKAEIVADINGYVDQKHPSISAHVWLYSVDDKTADTMDIVIADFGVGEYPMHLNVTFANDETLKHYIPNAQKKLVSQVMDKFDYKHLKYYEVADLHGYTMLIYDPNLKDASQSIKGRIYAASIPELI